MTLIEARKTTLRAYKHPWIGSEFYFFGDACFYTDTYQQVLGQLPEDGYVDAEYPVYPVFRYKGHVNVFGVSMSKEEAEFLRDRINITLRCMD